jgi:hypothetical protein
LRFLSIVFMRAQLFTRAHVVNFFRIVRGNIPSQLAGALKEM